MPILKAIGVLLTLIVIAASAWMNFEYMAGEGTGRAPFRRLRAGDEL